MKAQKHRKTGGFKVPEGYFKDLSGQMEQRLGEFREAGIPRDAGFRIPEGYFENLGERVSQQLAMERGKVRKLRITYISWSAAAVAAAVALVLTLRPAAIPESIGFEDLAGNEIQQYLEEGDADLETYDLAESLPLEEIALADILETVPREDQILDYLDRDTDSFEDFIWDNDE